MFRRLDPMNACGTQQKIDRSLDELVGLCRGIIADGVLVRAEAEFLTRWLEAHALLSRIPDAAALIERLASALEDGVLDADEERDILEAITAIAIPEDISPNSGSFAESAAAPAARAKLAALPYDNPANFDLAGACVVLTGVFLAGSKAHVTQLVEAAGGSITSAVSGRTDYVIVGKLGSSDWLTSAGGTKIRAAMEGRKHGLPVRLISETHMMETIARRSR